MVSTMAATSLMRAESERRIAGRRSSREGALDTKLFEQQFERRQLDWLIGRAERNHHAAASQAPEGGGDRLAARGCGQHHLRATKLLERLGDVGGGAVDIVMRAQFLRQLGPVAAAVDRDDLEPHVARVLHAEVAQPADPKHRDQVSRPRRRVPQRAEGRQAGAQQRRRIDR